MTNPATPIAGAATAGAQPCRLCGSKLTHVFADLGMSPPSNAYLHAEELGHMEAFYPLRTMVCADCKLVQLPELAKAESIFGGGEYLYFSSYSESWLRHAEAYAGMMVERFGLGPSSLVVEVASNDGYLLQYFKRRGVPVLGVEPAGNVARVAEAERGIPTLVKFFGVQTARELVAEGKQADVIAGNNVLAHVPDLHDFVGGMKVTLKPTGVVTVEFPHLLRLMEETQFDTIYHEHFSYISLLTATAAFARQGLTVFDVEELSTHGGSLRVFARHAEDASKPITDRVHALARREAEAGLDRLEPYLSFRPKVEAVKRDLLAFLIEAKRQGKKVVGYGAPAKGNTLLNYCGVREDLLDFTVDRSPHKQGMFLPGTHIPIFAPSAIEAAKPDYVLILPWNLRDEITAQMAHVKAWGGRFVVPIPRLELLP